MESSAEKQLSPSVSPDVETAQNSPVDPDALKLAEMGYTQDMSRNFSVWSVLGVGFSLTNSWFGISAALITGINSGGPLLIIYGIMLIALISTVIKTWHVFLAYQIANIFCFFFNCYGKTLPTVAQVTLWTSLVSFAIILITVPAVAPTHQHAKFVFATFINNTGWEQGGIAFIVGLVNTNWSFACLDCATHLAEEVHRPEKMVPIAIMGTVAIGFVTSWFFSMAMFFSIVGDFADIGASATGVPILEVFNQALSHKAGAIVLEALIIATGLGCLIASHTWQSRLCWSFARDRGLPAHRWLSKVDKRLDVPLNAHFVSCVIVAIMGCLYLASLTAFNS
ncbi:choline transporter [Neocucurbitaria cava]|uniref:Choline transporter n=1 Tax=Neocucurbitaria cava TaxID=798079 RepID=A0A9W9CKZ0_9PLEO|nr:choline transporter [Neocucurbitaria cava]